MVQEFWDVHQKELPGPTHRSPVHWSPLPEVSFKANIDAALFNGTNNVGIWVVVRDHLGYVIAALSQRVNSIHSVETAEELAARRAVLLAGELSLFDVIF